jgi:hypothetical protein
MNFAIYLALKNLGHEGNEDFKDVTNSLTELDNNRDESCDL